MEVLALDLISAPNLTKRLLESAGPKLQYLQLVMAPYGPASQLYEGFWTAVGACTGLAVLQLVFLPGSELPVDPQVASK